MRAPRAWAARSVSTSSALGSSSGFHIGMTTVCALSTSASRKGVSMVIPLELLARTGGSTAAHTRSSYQGSTSSLRSRPNTSQATLSSNGLTPCVMIAATRWGRRRVVVRAM